MEVAIDIVKSILLSKLEKDANFDNNKADATFWESFATALLDFEKDATPCIEILNGLELNNPEKITTKLPSFHKSYVKELAENYVLGNESFATETLLKSNNKVFNEEVRFLSNLEEAITEMERERIKIILSTANESLIAELSNKESEVKNSVIPLYVIKFAVAACLILGLGILIFNNQNPEFTPENTVVTAPVKKDTVSEPIEILEIPSEALAEVATVTNNVTVIESGLGFASKKNNIKIVENNQKARMVSIVSAIEKYRQLLENEFPENKAGVSSRITELETKINSLQKELALLKEREKQYVFDGKALVLYVSNFANENAILLYEDKYYLKRDSDFYRLSVVEQSQNLIKVTDSVVNEELYNLFSN